MYMHKIGVISLSIIGVAAVLMVVTAPTLENQQALAVNQPGVSNSTMKSNPPSTAKPNPPSTAKPKPPSTAKPKPPVKPRHKVRFVKRCGFNRAGKRVCRWVPVRVRR